MPALAIDTSTKICSVALGPGGKPPDEIAIDAGRTHLEVLLPAVEELLGRQGVTAAALELIVAGTGPGTFSGLRVGIATARALAQALEIPITGSSSLAALAAATAASTELTSLAVTAETPAILPVIDARRGQVFAQIYRTNGGGVEPGSEIFCLSPDELIAQVSKTAGATVAVGNGVLAYHDLFAASPLRLPLPASGLHRISAAWHLPGEPVRLKYSPADLLAVKPVYVRAPDADKTVLLRKREPWL